MSTALATDYTVRRIDEMEGAFGGSFVRAGVARRERVRDAGSPAAAELR